jgi:TonB family protein
MMPDRTDITSFVLSMIIHLTVLLLLSRLITQQEPRHVALITDVTLVDVNDLSGRKGEEQKTVGLDEKKQQKIATSIKNKVVKKTPVKKNKTTDVKSLLKKIEAEKASLDMGVNRENLRNMSEETEPSNNASSEDEGTENTEEKVVAGGAPSISGALAARKYKKFDWKFPEKLPEETELMIEITVMPSGIIKNVKLVRTSGYPELDRLAFSQARKMQFDPLPPGAKEEEQLGVLLFKFGVEK